MYIVIKKIENQLCVPHHSSDRVTRFNSAGSNAVISKRGRRTVRKREEDKALELVRLVWKN